MIAFLNWLRTDAKEEAKLGLALLFAELLALAAVEFVLAMWLQTYFSNTIAIVGFIWILITFFFIYRSNVVIDGWLVAKITGLEIGATIEKAIYMLLFAQAATVAFFLIIPIWQFPVVAPIFIFILGWLSSAALAETKFDWNKPRMIFISLCALTVGIAVFSAILRWFYGVELTAETIRAFFAQPVCAMAGKAALFASILLLIGFFFKFRKIKILGGVILVLTFGCWLFNEEWDKYGKETANSLVSSDKVDVFKDIRVPACTTVNTGIKTRGELVKFIQPVPKEYVIVSRSGNNDIRVVDTEYTASWSVEHGRPAPTIHIRGGPEPTTLTIMRPKTAR